MRALAAEIVGGEVEEALAVEFSLGDAIQRGGREEGRGVGAAGARRHAVEQVPDVVAVEEEVVRADGGPGDEGAAGVDDLRRRVVVEQQRVPAHDLQIHGWGARGCVFLLLLRFVSAMRAEYYSGARWGIGVLGFVCSTRWQKRDAPRGGRGNMEYSSTAVTRVNFA